MYIYFDFGSNSLKTVIYEINSKTINIIDELYFVNRLGNFDNEQKLVKSESVNKTIEYIRTCFSSYNIHKINATGTEVFRTAENAVEVIDKIKSETKVDISVLSSEDEAKLIFNVNKLFKGNSDILLVDSGGMSTEIVTSDYLQSINCGAVNLTNKFELNNQVGRTILNKAIMYVLSKINVQSFNSKYTKIILTGGSAGVLSNLTNENRISLKQLNDFIREYCVLSHDARIQYKGIPEDRADIILGGAVIIKAIMKLVGNMEADISKLGLRYGMLHKLHPNIRQFTIVKTGKIYSLDS